MKGMGASNFERPSGPPPPSAAPLSQLKPPPMAPPPRDMAQNMQRPAVENIRGVQIPRGPAPPRNFPPGVTEVPRGPPPGRGPPPRSPLVSSQKELQDLPSGGSTATQLTAAPKFAAMGRPPPQRKAGAISMFDEEKIPGTAARAEVGQAQEKEKPMAPMADPTAGMMLAKSPRPLPPQALRAGKKVHQF